MEEGKNQHLPSRACSVHRISAQLQNKFGTELIPGKVMIKWSNEINTNSSSEQNNRTSAVHSTKFRQLSIPSNCTTWHRHVAFSLRWKAHWNVSYSPSWLLILDGQWEKAEAKGDQNEAATKERERERHFTDDDRRAQMIIRFFHFRIVKSLDRKTQLTFACFDCVKRGVCLLYQSSMELKKKKKRMVHKVRRRKGREDK